MAVPQLTDPMDSVFSLFLSPPFIVHTFLGVIPGISQAFTYFSYANEFSPDFSLLGSHPEYPLLT